MRRAGGAVLALVAATVVAATCVGAPARELERACAEIARNAGPGIERRSGPFPVEELGHTFEGCSLVGRGPIGDDGSEPTPSLRESLTASGWREDPRFSADGPDGTFFALRRDDVVCLVSARWNGGVGEDGELVKAQDYLLSAGCTRSEELEELEP